MRVLYFYQYFTTARGSWSTRAHEFARRWVEKGDEVTIVTSVYDKSDLAPSQFVTVQEVDGIRVCVLNIRLSNKHGVAARLFSFATYAIASCWYALRVPADVVLSSSGPITVALPGLVAHYLRRVPFVFEARDLWPEGAIQLRILRNPIMIWLARAFEKSCYRAADQVVALSEGIATWIRERHSVDSVVVVPNASDNSLSQRVATEGGWPDASHGYQVLYAGTLGLIDDCRQILDMAHVLDQEGHHEIRIGVIGDGKERAELEEYASELGLQNVRFFGLMSREDVFRRLLSAKCALFVCKDVPFLSTASPNKLFDAFACGIPVVQTTQGWIKDLIEREDCGITVRPADPKALACAVAEVVRNDALRQRLSLNAKRVALEMFDRGKLAEEMRQVLLRTARKA